MPVRVERDGRGVATVILDQPAKLNALDSEMLDALADCMATIGAEAGLRVVVLRGAGERAFVGGADVREMAALSGPGPARAFITRVHRACESVRRTPVPVIARLNGHVLGAGLELAASCDMRVADRSALLGMPEVRIGLPSVVEAALLPRLIGWGRTSRLLFTGETIGADQALAWGLVEEVTEIGALDEAIARLADAIIAAGEQAVRLQKRLIAEWEALPVEAAIKRGIDCFESAWRGDEPRRMLDEQVAAMRARKAGA